MIISTDSYAQNSIAEYEESYIEATSECEQVKIFEIGLIIYHMVTQIGEQCVVIHV